MKTLLASSLRSAQPLPLAVAARRRAGRSALGRRSHLYRQERGAGRRLLRLRQRRLAEDRDHPADRSYRRRQSRARQAERGAAEGHRRRACTPRQASPTPKNASCAISTTPSPTEAAIEAAGLSHAQADLDTIAALKTPDRCRRARWAIRALGLDGPFGIYLGVDDKNPTHYSVNLDQSGLGMPDRDYYLRDDKEIADTRDAYKKYLAQMLALRRRQGCRRARRRDLRSSSTTSPTRHWPAADRRDADKIYNPMTVSDLEKMAPRLPVGRVLRRGRHSGDLAEGRAHGDRGGTLRVPEARRGVRRDAGRGVARLSDDALPAQLSPPICPRRSTTPISRSTARCCSGKTAAARPRNARRPAARQRRWARRSASSMSRNTSRPRPRRRPTRSSHNLLKAYDADIKTLDWMTPATRAKALEKLHALHAEDRLSRQVARLFGARHHARRSGRRHQERDARSNGTASWRASTIRSTAPNGA